MNDYLDKLKNTIHSTNKSYQISHTLKSIKILSIINTHTKNSLFGGIKKFI
jgi:hypothetical protein